MKKLVSFLMALMMAALLIPAVAETATDTFLGTWYMVEMSQDGVTIDPATMGLDITLILNEDGTFEMGLAGESEQGTWEATDAGLVLTLGEDTLDIVVGDGELTSDLYGMPVKFSREPGEAATAPEKITAESEDAFLGEYKADLIDMFGMLMPVSVMGMEGSVTIEPGKVIIKSEATDQNAESETFGQLISEEHEFATTFADGVLKYVDDSTIVTINSIIALTETGVMLTQEEDPEADFNLTVNMYYVRAE